MKNNHYALVSSPLIGFTSAVLPDWLVSGLERIAFGLFMTILSFLCTKLCHYLWDRKIRP